MAFKPHFLSDKNDRDVDVAFAEGINTILRAMEFFFGGGVQFYFSLIYSCLTKATYTKKHIFFFICF